jgi:hypothetical protein
VLQPPALTPQDWLLARFGWFSLMKEIFRVIKVQVLAVWKFCFTQAQAW